MQNEFNGLEVSPEQWSIYEKRYGRLMWKISHKISGDRAISEPEDNYSDLCVTAIESINGFYRKTGQTVDEMFSNQLFDAYTKTCLWHKKNSKGTNITKKFPLTNKTISMHGNQNGSGEENALSIPDCSPGPITSLELEEFFNRFTSTQALILDKVCRDPSIIMGTGRISMSKLSRATGLPVDKLKREIQLMEKEYEFTSSSQE